MKVFLSYQEIDGFGYPACGELNMQVTTDTYTDGVNEVQVHHIWRIFAKAEALKTAQPKRIVLKYEMDSLKPRRP